MKLKLLSVLALALPLAAFAQTNPPAADAGTRSVSLDECISLALEKNLDLRIERFNPELSVFDLSIARGTAYDPVLSATVQHERERTRGLYDSTSSNTFPAAVTDTDSLAKSSLRGGLPWGMSYSLDSTLSEKRADSWSFSTNTASFLNTPSRTSSGSVGVTLTQPLLRNSWTDSGRTAISVAKNRVKYSAQGLRSQLISTVSSVETAYYELIYAHEFVAVQEKSLQLAEKLFQENSKRVEVGVLAPLDQKQAESQMAARRADLIAAQRTLETRENALKVLITDDYAALHDVRLLPAEPLAATRQFYDLRASWSRGLNDRPDMLQSRLDLERAGIQLKYYRNQLFPQLDLFGTYGRLGGGAVLDDTLTQFRHENDSYYIAGISFSVPLGNVAARKRYESGKVTVEQAVLSQKKFEQTVMVQIDEAIKQAQSSFERVDATRQAREFAEDALAAEQKKLENDKSTPFQILRLQNDLTAARSAEIRALADYNEALTALAQTEGSTLERRKIDVRVK
jgi:outer membrane protein TolC